MRGKPWDLAAQFGPAAERARRTAGKRGCMAWRWAGVRLTIVAVVRCGHALQGRRVGQRGLARPEPEAAQRGVGS